MKSKSANSVEVCLKRMVDLVAEETGAATFAQNRSLKPVADAIQRLDSRDVQNRLSWVHDLESDSLAKVNYYIDLALKTFSEIQAPTLHKSRQAPFLLALGETYERLGNFGAALAQYQGALEDAATANDPRAVAQLKYRAARIHAQRGEWALAQGLLKDALPVFRSDGANRETAMVIIELAKIAYRQGHYRKAERIFTRARQACERAGYGRGHAVISNHLGMIQRMQGHLDLAYVRFQEALTEFQSLQDPHGIAEVTNNLGQVHLQRQRHGEAFDCFEKALRIGQASGHFPLLAYVFANKGAYYCAIGDQAMAANMCARALEYMVRMKTPIGLARINMLLGRILWRSGEAGPAEAFYRESMRLYKQFGIPLGLANCAEEFAALLADTGRGQQAHRYLTRAGRIRQKLFLRPGAKRPGKPAPLNAADPPYETETADSDSSQPPS